MSGDREQQAMTARLRAIYERHARGPDAARTAALHDDLMRWLREAHPRASLTVVISALSYEIARMVGMVTSDDDPAIRQMLDDVRDTMRAQITAYHAATLPAHRTMSTKDLQQLHRALRRDLDAGADAAFCTARLRSVEWVLLERGVKRERS